jgi:hypothetical protein
MHPVGTTLVRRMFGNHQKSALEALREEIKPEQIANAIVQAFKANTHTKRGVIPDHQTRLEGAKIALAYLVGKPHACVAVTFSPTSTDELALQRLLASSAARDKLRRLLAQTEVG